MNTKNIGLVALALVILLGVGAFFLSKKSNTEMKPAQAAVQQKEAPLSPAPITTYKDGEYKQEGDYTSPGGAEQIDVDLTIKNNMIIDAVVTSKAENPKSKFMQGVFVQNFKPYVIGKNIADLKLMKVSGSSLTPKGFNDALEKIKAQAKG